ncbi:HAD family hydrolase [Chitinophaga sp. 30R24]|uniref:HAD family hydrolase n=1 Tax=Chitinophaga sp. 30R24 TaxID=3248838 RepID=UPI003B9186FA
MNRIIFHCIVLLFVPWCLHAQPDPLPSWQEGPLKQTIVSFVQHVTQKGAITYVPPEDRIATFDNDGTLWAERPVVQELFAMYRIAEMIRENPVLKEQQPYKAVVNQDESYFTNGGEKSLVELVLLTHTGMTQEAFHATAVHFFETITHPVLKVPLSKTVYQPQLELLTYLRANGFKTFICSGGTAELIRAVSDQYYGIPAEQVIGTEFQYQYEDSTGLNDIVRLPGLRTLNDKQTKPVNILYHIGKRPILACGNEGAAGDIYMLRYSQGSNKYPSLQLLVNHDDPQREFYYQEANNQSLNWAGRYHWNVISMKNDWKTVFVK